MEYYKNNYDKSLELSKMGIEPTIIEWYWVDLTAYGLTDKELMIASEAEYQSKETKYISFTDFDSTIPAFSDQDLFVCVNNAISHANRLTRF